MEPFDPEEAIPLRELFDQDSLSDYLEQQVPDYAPEGVHELIGDYLDSIDLDDLWELFDMWEDDAAFWDWFRDEFYGEG